MTKILEDIRQHDTLASLLVVNQSIQALSSTHDSLTSLLMYRFLLYKVLPVPEHRNALCRVVNQLQQLPMAAHFAQENTDAAPKYMSAGQDLYSPALGYVLALLEEEQLLPDDFFINWLALDKAVSANALHQLRQRTYTAAKHVSLLQTLQYLAKRSTTPTALEQLKLVLHESLPFFSSQYVGMVAAKDQEHPAQVWLGLDRGIAANQLTLINAYKAYPHPAVSHVIRQGISYVLSFRRDIDFSEGSYSAFPASISSGYAQSHFTNALSWQSGDLVQSLVFYQASELFEDAFLENLANLIGLNTLLRTSRDATQITDIGLEKGSAGLALLYHFAYQITQNASYQRGCTHWLKHTLDYWKDTTLPSARLTDSLSDLPMQEEHLGIAFVLAYIAHEPKNTWIDWLLC
jgi:hypothetical protein